jgi:signal peptidase I
MAAAARKPGRALRLAREALLVSVVSLGLLTLSTRLIGQGYRVDGRCMEPRLYTGERVLGDKWTLRRRPPRRGEVIIFVRHRHPRELYIKRVVALGGEQVAMRRGVLTINNRPLAEPYLVRPARGDFGPYRVRKGCYFVLGDNRDVSDDSRRWGDVAPEAIVARAWLRYWPLGRRAYEPF